MRDEVDLGLHCGLRMVEVGVTWFYAELEVRYLKIHVMFLPML